MESYIKRAVIEILEKNLVISGFISVTLSLVLSFQLVKYIPGFTVSLWLVPLILSYFLRFIFSRRRLSRFNEHVSLNGFRLGCLTSGLIWGWCGYFFFKEVDPVTGLYISFTLGGLAAGASSSLAADKYSFLLFTVPLLVPNIVANFLIGSEVSIGMAVMLLLYISFLTFSSKSMGGTLVENLHLKKKAEDSEKEVKRLALYDQLTGLPNRFLFEDRLKQVISKHQREGKKFALLFIDLDGFKQVNDQYGHHIGDELLQVISKKFEGALRNEDTCARIGGDEFVVILQNIDLSGALNVSEKLLHLASTPMPLSKASVQVSASIGVSIYPDHAQTQNDLLIKSDRAMYRAKEKGKNKVVIHGEV